jgi:hypothetical protein
MVNAARLVDTFYSIRDNIHLERISDYIRSAKVGCGMPHKCKWVVLLALLTGWSAGAYSAQAKALSKLDLLKLLSGGVYNARIGDLVRERGITFIPNSHDLNSLQQAGADLALLNAVESARHVTAQLPEPGTAPRKQPVAPPTRVRRVRSIRRNVDVPATTAVVPRSVPHKQQPSATAVAGIPVGTTITVANWRQYSQYMPFGMTQLFKGDQFWKMPADLEINVGPTTPVKLPLGYEQATARFSDNVRIIHLPNGHRNIQNYAGGEPFPHPQEPDKGYKLLADLWFSYVPHFIAGTPSNPLTICSETSNGFSNCERLSYVYRQVAYNTDEPASSEERKGSDYWYTEWLTVEEPEEQKYTTLLMLYPRDNQRAEELFVYIPSLRRWTRSSLASRCSPVTGTDYVQDDFKRVGFNGGLGMFDAQFLGHQRILALTGDYSPLGGDFPLNYYTPLGWPRPSWGRWQLRDVDVIDVRRIPAESSGYCYGKRIIYEDSQTHYALWEDVYDRQMRFWKTAFLAQRLMSKPGLGEVPGSFSSTAWDFQGRHLTNATTQGKSGRDVLVDDEVPREYRNFTRYSTLAGLSQIMK